MMRILAVCAAAHDRAVNPRRPDDRTAIDKRPVSGPVHVGRLGLDIDHVCDTVHHGGEEQAVYAYSDREARRWADELGRDLPFGWFGENLRIDGPTTDLVVGSRLQVGTTLVLETTIPRTPCNTFALWAAEDSWVKRFAERGDVGTYLRVVTPGPVTAGDTVTVLDEPRHGATIRDVFTASRPDRLRALLDRDDLPAKVARDARAALNRAS